MKITAVETATLRVPTSRQRPVCERGEFVVPDRPGPGIALAPGAVDRYRAR